MDEFVPYQSSLLALLEDHTLEDVQPIHQEKPISSTPVVIKTIILNVKIRYNYEKIDQFIDELQRPNEMLVVGDEKFSVFQLYTLHLLDDPIDMSSLNDRKIYRPKLFVRKNDKFSPFNFKYLLNLFDIEYQMDEAENKEFPKLWKTTFQTNVLVNPIKVNPTVDIGQTSFESNTTENKSRNLLDVFKIICREQKYDEECANKWKEAFEGN